MRNGRLYQSPTIELKELLAGIDILKVSNPIEESSGGYLADDYNLNGDWW